MVLSWTWAVMFMCVASSIRVQVQGSRDPGFSVWGTSGPKFRDPLNLSFWRKGHILTMGDGGRLRTLARLTDSLIRPAAGDGERPPARRIRRPARRIRRPDRGAAAGSEPQRCPTCHITCPSSPPPPSCGSLVVSYLISVSDKRHAGTLVVRAPYR